MSISFFNRYLNHAEEKQLFATVKNHAGILARRDYAWLRLFRQTGLRVGTMAKLTVGHALDALKQNYLTIEPEIAKRKKGGMVFCTAGAKRALKDLLIVREKMGHPCNPDAPLIMSRQNGVGLSVRSFEARVSYWREQAGLPVDVTPHWFRHTLAKRIMRNSTAKDPRGIVKRVLLHSSIESTAIYTQPDKEDIEQAMAEAC